MLILDNYDFRSNDVQILIYSEMFRQGNSSIASYHQVKEMDTFLMYSCKHKLNVQTSAV